MTWSQEHIMNQNHSGTLTALLCCSLGAVLPACVTVGCDTAGPTAPRADAPLVSEGASTAGNEKKIGVLLVSHGSHSENWRKMLLEIEDDVRNDVLAGDAIAGIQSAFMEYNEPSIATQLKKFDAQGYTDVILVPLLMTVSSHSFDDIPTIAGQKQDHKSMETLRLEGIEIYRPKARVTLAPLLDFPDVLTKNVTRRVRRMSEDPSNEGIVLVAYGSTQYNEEWKALLAKVSREVKQETGVDCVEYSWCGHIVDYKSEPTEIAIREVLRQKHRALVVPVLVAVSEMFQGKIIGGAIKAVGEKGRIAYRHDAILPDENINRWIVDISLELASKVANRQDTSSNAP
ncbi:MAG TPA: cobalamin biosynthesis protein CbiX [Planctomycetes bacterium]|nr:cobalamin biosynthesis protein CbiX [Planctomycetota bacterium]